jgi:nucleotide-binding universal stress UspA family protein
MTQSMPYQVIIVALDGSSVSDLVLSHARTLAGAFGSTLVLIHASHEQGAPLDPPLTTAEPGREQAARPGEMALGSGAVGGPAAAGGVGYPAAPLIATPSAAEPPEYLRNLEDTAATGDLNIRFNQLRDAGFAVEQVSSDEDFAETILTEAQARSAGLIIIGSRDQSGLGRLLFGNTTDKVLREARCPVLVMRNA